MEWEQGRGPSGGGQGPDGATGEMRAAELTEEARLFPPALRSKCGAVDGGGHEESHT